MRLSDYSNAPAYLHLCSDMLSGFYHGIAFSFQKPSVCRRGYLLCSRLFRTSAVISEKFSRFPVPELASLPEDVRERITAVAVKVCH